MREIKSKRKIVLVGGILDSGDVPRLINKNLIEMGHKVELILVDEDLPYIERNLVKRGKRFSHFNLGLFSRRIYKAVKRIQADILFIYGSNWAVTPRMMNKIKSELGCKIILWEGNLQFWRWFQAETLKLYDFVFVSDSYAIPMLSGPAGLKNVIHLPGNMCEPDIHRPLELTDEERKHYGSDIGFIGMGNPQRREFFENLVEFDLKLWGKQWDKSDVLKPFFVDESVGMEEKIRIYQCAKINVNIQSDKFQINGISAKIFEIASTGGFFITDKKQDLELFFIKEELEDISFSSIAELKEKIDFYLKNPEKRKEIAGRIRDKVINNYTYKHKLEEMLNHIKW